MLQGAQGPHAQRVTLHSKASSNSLNGLSESGQFPACTPPASPVQTPVAEVSKEKTLHASDSEGIKAEGQAAAMAAIAAAQAQANGRAPDESRANSGEYWVRSNSEEDLERADSGGLQVCTLSLQLSYRQLPNAYFVPKYPGLSVSFGKLCACTTG